MKDDSDLLFGPTCMDNDVTQVSAWPPGRRALAV